MGDCSQHCRIGKARKVPEAAVHSRMATFQTGTRGRKGPNLDGGKRKARGEGSSHSAYNFSEERHPHLQRQTAGGRREEGEEGPDRYVTLRWLSHPGVNSNGK